MASAENANGPAAGDAAAPEDDGTVSPLEPGDVAGAFVGDIAGGLSTGPGEADGPLGPQAAALRAATTATSIKRRVVFPVNRALVGRIAFVLTSDEDVSLVSATTSHR